MKHEDYEELLLLSLYDELRKDQQDKLSRHLAECSSCRDELAELQEFHSLADTHKPVLPERLLQEARAQLRGALLSETYYGRGKPSLWERFSEWTRANSAPLAAAASLALGIGIGYLLFSSSPDPFVGDNLTMANLQLVDSDPSDGIIEVSFDEVRPMQMRGSVSDKKIQDVLAQVLLRSRNPGVRLRAADAIYGQPVQPVDPKIQDALILSLKYDQNIGVRKRAFDSLQQQPFDPNIREAFLYVLMNDENSGMRVAAINALEAVNDQHWSIRPELLDALQQRIDEEENNFVRLRSKAFLEEVRYQ